MLESIHVLSKDYQRSRFSVAERRIRSRTASDHEETIATVSASRLESCDPKPNIGRPILRSMQPAILQRMDHAMRLRRVVGNRRSRSAEDRLMDLIPSFLERTILTDKLIVKGLFVVAGLFYGFVLWSRPLIPFVNSSTVGKSAIGSPSLLNHGTVSRLARKSDNDDGCMIIVLCLVSIPRCYCNESLVPLTRPDTRHGIHWRHRLPSDEAYLDFVSNRGLLLGGKILRFDVPMRILGVSYSYFLPPIPNSSAWGFKASITNWMWLSNDGLFVQAWSCCNAWSRVRGMAKLLVLYHWIPAVVRLAL